MNSCSYKPEHFRRSLKGYNTANGLSSEYDLIALRSLRPFNYIAIIFMIKKKLQLNVVVRDCKFSILEAGGGCAWATHEVSLLM